MRNVEKLSLSLFVGALLSSCASVQMPCMDVYSIAGIMQAGADKASTCSDETSEVSMHEIFKILEDGAIIIPSNDFKRNKTASEQACYKLGARCSYEVRQAIQDFNRRTDFKKRPN